MIRFRANTSMLLALIRTAAITFCLSATAYAANASATSQQEGKENEEDRAAKTARPSLEDRIAPVSGNLFQKAERIELTPSLGISVYDAFFQKYSVGLKMSYHITESFSAGLHGTYLFNTPRGGLSRCDSQGCEEPTLDQLQGVPGRVSLLAGIDVAWSPFYGKINILAEKVLHFDTAILLGANVVQYKSLEQQELKNSFAPGGNIGLTERIFLSPNIVLRLEFRNYIYQAKVPIGSSDTKIENQLVFEVGVSFFLGAGPKE